MISPATFAETASAESVEGVRKATFLRLISTYESALQRLAAAYASRRSEQEDIVQDIAMGLWLAIPRFRGEASERTWLYRIAHNTATTAAAKLHRRDRTESKLNEALDSPASSTSSADEQLIRQQKRELLLKAMRELPAIDRQVLALHLEDLSYREIQEITGLSEGAVATRLSRIRDRLAREIRETEGGRR